MPWQYVTARRNPTPGLWEIWKIQVRNRESSQAGFWFRPDPCRPFVADLTAGAGRCAGEGRDCGRMIMRFDFHQQVRPLLDLLIGAALYLRQEAYAGVAAGHCRIIAVR